MRFAYFIFFQSPESKHLPISAEDKLAITEIVSTTPMLSKALFYTPEVAHDKFGHKEAPPSFGMQLYFDELTHLEEAIAPEGHLQALTTVFSSLEGTRATQQAMYVRSFSVTEPDIENRGDALPCSYVVHYPGPAQDINEWLSHYLAHHPDVMRQFPGIRAIEILSRVDWCSALPFDRVEHMQRNRVMFDSPEALTTALQSPARDEMRKDYHAFPPYEGGNHHYPMATQTILPQTGLPR